MAASNIDEINRSTNQKTFLSSSSDSSSRIIPNRQKCPLCRKFRKVFYCKDCINSGLFYSSKSNAAEGFIDKQKTLFELKDARKTFEINCLKCLESKQKSDALYSKIRQSRDRNRILKLALEERKQSKTRNVARLLELREKNEKHKKNLPKYDHKVQELENYVAGWREKVEKSRTISKQKQDDIRKFVKLRIQQLFKYIFPMYKVKPPVEVEFSDDMVSALAEASQTTFIRDRWEYTDYSGEMHYCIVAPSLPGSGNYSAYNVWIVHNRGALPGTNPTLSVEHNPAYSIGAALTYTVQLVNILSFYLNVRLPYKMSYSDFCTNDILEQHRFARKVARLNANVLYLCFSQKVDALALRSCETIHNVLQLIEDENADLGRLGPLEIDMNQANALEQPLINDLKITDDSDSDEGDILPVEWEAVPLVQCPEIAAGPVNVQSPQMVTTQQASSMAGGLVNSAAASIASIWRGFTGR